MQTDELQRMKFWLYVQNNELEKEKLKYKLQVQGIHKYKWKMAADTQSRGGSHGKSALSRNLQDEYETEHAIQPQRSTNSG